MHHPRPAWLHPIALILIVDPDGSESSNTMPGRYCRDPLLQEVSNLAMGWLVKLCQVHHISESALGDVLRMCMSLYTPTF